MVAVPSPESLHNSAVEQYDVFLSFTRTTPGMQTQIDGIVRALRDRGLTVFIDSDIEEFAGITDALMRGLAGSTVLLAHYSRQYPRRYACQWELTAAFIAAQRLGDPCRRVLVINPDGPRHTDHLAPVELADARFFDALRTADDYQRLARKVEAAVRALSGPIGAAAPIVDATRLPDQVMRPRRFTGRYGAMWSIHSGLRAADFPGVHLPSTRSAVLVSGLTGTGKTSLAAQYAFLYRDAYPGGVHWVGPLGGTTARGDGTTVLAQAHRALRDIARAAMDLPVRGVEPAQLRDMVASHLTKAGERVLWVIDDVPPELPPGVLDELLIPSPVVRTLLTSRTPAHGWDARSILLGGLDEEEALALFAEVVPMPTRAERKAVRELVQRCSGHPMVLARTAAMTRRRRSPATDLGFVEYLGSAAPSVADAVRADLDDLGDDAKTVLRTAAVLAASPFPPELVSGAWGAAQGDAARDRLGPAADQLIDRGLMQVVGSHWEIHALVSETVGAGADLSEAARKVAETVAGMLDDGPGADPCLVPHARRLGERPDVPVTRRRLLLRYVSAHHERQGSIDAAADVMDLVLALSSATTSDRITAADLHRVCGRHDRAVELAREAAANATTMDDHHARFRADLVAAQALDGLGHYDEADDLLWSRIRSRGVANWVSGSERAQALLALAVATRVRGRPKEALPLVKEVVAAGAALPPDDNALAAQLELARLLQLTGDARTARKMARDVVTHYRNADMPQHARLLQAEGIAADASLTLDLTELNAKPELWQSSERELRRLADRYAETFGPYNALTLAARVRADRALLSLGQPDAALTALAGTERVIVGHLGPDSLLLLHTRHATAIAYSQRREYARAAQLLAPVLEERRSRLGPKHPETLECQLDLGIALAMTGDSARACQLVDEAAEGLRGTTGGTDLAGKATTAQAVLRLPYWVLVMFNHVEKFFGSRKGPTS